MAAVSEEFILPKDKGLKQSSSTGSALSLNATTMDRKRTHNNSNSSNSISSELSSTAMPIKSEHRRPSFSIILPPSFSRSSQLDRSVVFNTLAGADDDNNGDSTAGFEDALAMREATSEEAGINQNISNNPSFRGLDQPVRRRSVHFFPGEDDLLSHEGKHGLPKTPYPTTGEQEARIQSSLLIK